MSVSNNEILGKVRTVCENCGVAYGRQASAFCTLDKLHAWRTIEGVRCPHCPVNVDGSHRGYCPRFTGQLAETQIEGFKTFKDFARALCLWIVGMEQASSRGDLDGFFDRAAALHEAAKTFLIMYGTGEPENLSGVLTDKPAGLCSVCGK